MALSQVPNGYKVTIVSMNISDTWTRRLNSMGIVPGSRIRVIDNSMKDTSILECRGSKLALGRGLSRFVEVQ